MKTCRHSLIECGVEFVPITSGERLRLDQMRDDRLRPKPPLDTLHDEDGRCIGLRYTSKVDSPAKAVRELLDLDDYYGDDMFVEVGGEDSGVFRARLSTYRELVHSIELSYFRLADPDVAEEIEGEFGLDTWWPCNGIHPRAVAYWVPPS